MFRVGSDWLCESCADELTVVCDTYGERIYSEDAVEDSNYTLCESCFDRITSVVQIATAFCGVTAPIGTTMTLIARPAGTITAR